MTITVAKRRMHPRQVFRIARGEKRFVENVFLRIERDGITGYGEASPNAFYQETAVDVASRLAGLASFLEAHEIRGIADIEACWRNAWPLLAPSRAAQCALDLALWDWLAKKLGKTVSELALGQAAEGKSSFCTIGLSTPEELPAKFDELRDHLYIKVKSSVEALIEPVRALRKHNPEAIIAVDANCAWAGQNLWKLGLELLELSVSFIEQPYAPGHDDSLKPFTCALPILADESCVVEEDVPRVLQHYDGFNVKLVKCGGLTPALRMLRQGLAAEVQTMVGCMLESSLLISAGLVAAQLSEFADLDGAWLLGDDPFTGLSFDRGTLSPSAAPGFGVEPSPDLFP